MKKRDELQELIQSMSSSEKRYFKMQAATQKGDKQYLKLFDLLSRSQVHDDANIRRKLDARMTVNRYHFTRNYLYQALLDSLRLYHARSKQISLKNLLQEIGILYNKGLFTACLKLIRKGHKHAEEQEDYLLQAELLEWESSVAQKILDQQAYSEKLFEIHKRQQSIMEQYACITEADYLYRRLELIHNKFRHPRTEAQLAACQEILAEPLFDLLEKEEKLPLSAEISLLKARIIYHLSCFEHEAQFRYADRLRLLFQKNEQFCYRLPEEYIASLSLYLRSCSYVHARKLFDQGLKSLYTFYNNLPKVRQNPALEAAVFYVSCYNRFFFDEYNFDMAGAINIVDEARVGLEKHEEHLSQVEQLYLVYSISLAYFGVGRFEDALEWLNRILDHFRNVDVSVVDLRVRLLLLISHYELGNDRLLEYLIISTYRYLSRRRKMYQYESAVIRFIRKLSNVLQPDELDDLFHNLRSELLNIIRDPYEYAACAWLVYWLEAKERNIALNQLFEEKAGKLMGTRPGAAV